MTSVSEALTPTEDLGVASQILAAVGACVVAGALDPETLAEVHRALYRAAESDRTYGVAQPYKFGGDDHINQRVWNLPSRDPVFWALSEHPVAMHFVEQILGWPALLSSMSANIAGAGGQSMVLHCDQGYMPRPWDRAHGINVGWCVDEFTVQNGATSCIPGSHLWDDESLVGACSREQLVPITAPAGSAIVMDGRLYHTNGVNTNGVRRAGVFSFYTLPIYLPQENWFLSANPAIRQFGSERLQTLLGFRPELLGRVNGLDRI